jgi:hypothetical protein
VTSVVFGVVLFAPAFPAHTSPASADYLRAAGSAIGVDVIGRLFDLTNGWNVRPAATSEQILMAANKPNGLQLAIATGRSVVAQAPRHARRQRGCQPGKRSWPPH